MNFNKVTTLATNPGNSWSNLEKATFHYFNSNGLLAHKRILDDVISEMVENGLCKSGAVIAYGSLNNFNCNELYKLIKSKKVSAHVLYAVLDGLKRDINYSTKFINETKGTI